MIIIGNFKRARRDRRGVSLIELIIAIGIFSVVMVIAFDAFLGVLKVNRETVQKQSVQDHTEFLFNLMTKEIKFARVNYLDTDTDCSTYFKSLSPGDIVSPNATYAAVDGNRDNLAEELRFQNYEGLCVRYFFAPGDTTRPDSLKVARYDPRSHSVQESWVLPIDIRVSDLDFRVANKFDARPGGPLEPPAVKLSIGLISNIWSPSRVNLSEVIVGRNLEQF